MSEQDSDYVTESGRRDSAYTPQAMQGPSLTLLDCQSVRPRIQDWNTDKDTPGPDFAIRAYDLGGGPAGIPRSLPSNSSSMAYFGASFTDLTPSLSSGSTGSDSSVQSSAAGSAVREGPLDDEGRYVDATHDNQSERSCSVTGRRSRYTPCLYQFLGCKQTTFEDTRGWYEHSKSHLRGQAPPKNLRCPYSSCTWTTSSADGEVSWKKREAHLESNHDVLADGEPLCEKRDAQLYEHLWRLHVISSAQLQELRQSGRLGSDSQPYVTTEKPERRRNRPVNSRTNRYNNMPQR
jgi:hypothetical protein